MLLSIQNMFYKNLICPLVHWVISAFSYKKYSSDQFKINPTCVSKIVYTPAYTQYILHPFMIEGFRDVEILISEVPQILTYDRH